MRHVYSSHLPTIAHVFWYLFLSPSSWLLLQLLIPKWLWKHPDPHLDFLMFQFTPRKSAKVTSKLPISIHPLLQSNSGNDSTGFSLLSGIITSAKWIILHTLEAWDDIWYSQRVPTWTNPLYIVCIVCTVCFVRPNWIHQFIWERWNPWDLWFTCGYSSVRRVRLAHRHQIQGHLSGQRQSTPSIHHHHHHWPIGHKTCCFPSDSNAQGP